MAWTSEDQYMLELVNRARLDPEAEAGRFGIDLNDGLAAGTISSAAKQVLAPNDLLHDAASLHSRWMLANDTFSHTGAGGSDPDDRMANAGYVFTAPWSWGENISWRGSTGAIQAGTLIGFQHEDLFLSAGHRLNILGAAFREVGISQELGSFTSGGTTYNASMVTQDFANSGNDVFLTGVAYSDNDQDDFYSVGEGVSGVRFAIGKDSTMTTSTGGYALQLAPEADVTVRVNGPGGSTSKVRIDLSVENVKLDLVDGNLFRTSGNLELLSGVSAAELLGIGDLTLIGNRAGNQLTGNRGDNLLIGNGGRDLLFGADGNDSLKGGSGADTLSGGNGDDRLLGGSGGDEVLGGNGRDRLILGGGGDTADGGGGRDNIQGNAGNDTLNGGGGNDTLKGGSGADHFIFDDGCGTDRIGDFQNDIDALVFDDALWGGGMTAAQVVSTFASVVGSDIVFDFGGGNTVTLLGFTALGALSDDILIV